MSCQVNLSMRINVSRLRWRPSFGARSAHISALALDGSCRGCLIKIRPGDLRRVGADLPGRLRQDHRPGTWESRHRRLQREGPMRRGGRRPLPGGPRQTGHQTLPADRRQRHPARARGCGRELQRFAPAGPHARQVRTVGVSTCRSGSPCTWTPDTTAARPANS